MSEDRDRFQFPVLMMVVAIVIGCGVSPVGIASSGDGIASSGDGIASSGDGIASSGDGPNDLDLWHRTVRQGIAYLESHGQNTDGSFSRSTGPGVTALVASALLRVGRTPSDRAVAEALDYVLTFVRDDGGIYQTGTLYRNYETCLAIVCLSLANRSGEYAGVIGRAEAFVKGLQWNEERNVDRSQPGYGGAGYGKHRRPDLSNTSFFIDTLRAVGRGPDDEALQQALVFVSRCQNLVSVHNTTRLASKNPDGGFYYTPAAGGTSQAGSTPAGGLRSYGSMTYAGLKSMIYAGVGPDDPRVRAAAAWIERHYTLQENPGLRSSGLYYYYHTFAKALDALGLDQVTEPNGRQHDWRRELTIELARRQQPNGSWVNENSRWFEGDANLVTGYAILSLVYCRPAAEESP